MGGFACSSWYFIRFASPHYGQGPFEPEAMRYWSPVDLYVGGAEHAVLHLLYARFWTKVLADSGLVPFREPFTKLLNQGQLMGSDGFRMSKSRGNVIIPDHVVAEHGADALRVYELFMAPFEQDVGWNMDGINGASRFLNRVWQLIGATYFESRSSVETDPELIHVLHKTIRRSSERIEGFRFNTMISNLMEFTNTLMERRQAEIWRTASYYQALETLLVLLAPVAPHIAEELWQLTGHVVSVHLQPWPEWDEDLARDETHQIAVQVNGKLRATIELPVDASQAEAEQLAWVQPKVEQNLVDKEVVKVFYVPGRILNIVTR